VAGFYRHERFIFIRDIFFQRKRVKIICQIFDRKLRFSLPAGPKLAFVIQSKNEREFLEFQSSSLIPFFIAFLLLSSLTRVIWRARQARECFCGVKKGSDDL